MEPMVIDLSDPLRRHVEQRAAAAGFETPGDFVRDLIERDQAASARLETLLLEAIDDEGEPIEIDDAWWAERHAELERRLAERRLAGRNQA